MKLTTADVSNLITILDTCLTVGIEAIIIDGKQVRGINQDKTCVILSDKNVPAIQIPMGINRIRDLKQRIELFGESINIDVKEGSRAEISSIDMNAGKSKASFRCASTLLIKAPKVINDTLTNRIHVSKEEMKVILTAARAMAAKRVAISIKKSGQVVFDMTDATHDSYSTELAKEVERLEGCPDTDSVTYYYDESVFSSIMKAQTADNFYFDIGAIGIIRIDLNGHEMTILPKINEEGNDNE